MEREQLGFVAAAVRILGLWLPSATVTLGGLAAATTNGQQIGSDILDLTVGWIAAVAGATGAAGMYRSEGGTALFSGVLALLPIGYAVLAIPGRESAFTTGDVDIDEVIQVEYGWGRSSR